MHTLHRKIPHHILVHNRISRSRRRCPRLSILRMFHECTHESHRDLLHCSLIHQPHLLHRSMIHLLQRSLIHLPHLLHRSMIHLLQRSLIHLPHLLHHSLIHLLHRCLIHLPHLLHRSLFHLLLKKKHEKMKKITHSLC